MTSRNAISCMKVLTILYNYFYTLVVDIKAKSYPFDLTRFSKCFQHT